MLWHASQRPGRHHFLIDALSEVWRKWGLCVSCAYGIKDRPEADLLIAHVDVTHRPAQYAEYIRSFPNAVNRDVVDISKRRISAHLLRRDDDYSGPVIVKTDDNCGGRPDGVAARRRHPFLARLRRKVIPIAESAFRQPLAWRRALLKYPIYNSLAEVPAGAFTNPALIVERFLPEKDGNRYFMRHYLCLGDHTRSVRVADSSPYMKRASCTLVEEGLAVPDSVLRLRRQLGLDYGKIDYTVHDGQAIILDVNPSPGVPGAPEVTALTVASLAEGIWSLLPKDA